MIKPGKEQESVTALVLVPQSNLAIQYYRWLSRITEGSISTEEVGIETDRIVQRLVREGQEHVTAGMKKLSETKPHILISTPQAVLDLYKKDPDLVPFEYLSTVWWTKWIILSKRCRRRIPNERGGVRMKKQSRRFGRIQGPRGNCWI